MSAEPSRRSWRAGWLDSLPNALVTLLLAALVLSALPPLVDWAILGSVWAPDAQRCRAAAGACWGVVAEKHRVMLFGLFPYEQQWRPFLVLLLYLAGFALSAWRRAWRPRLLLALWAAIVAASLILLWPVPSARWGGLALTLVLFTGMVVIGMPLALLLALGRRSAMPFVHAVSVVAIETIRGVPLVTVLFVAAVVFPLFLPDGVSIDKLLRAQLGMAVFFACYQAEVIRGGLAAIPRGQDEAAEALGLGYWPRMALVILPQALRIALPGLINHLIGAFKNTSLVVVIGLFDMLSATTAALADPLWHRFAIEAYLAVAVTYFAFCFGFSRLSLKIERAITIRR